MARLPYVEPAEASEPVREVFERLPVHLNLFKMMANAETCFRPLIRLGSAILGQQQLAEKLRELAILRVANLSSAEYEWVQHVPIARATGVTEAQIGALEGGSVDAGCFDLRERAVLRFTTELVQKVKASEGVYAELERHFSPREMVELILAIGFYMTVARLVENTEVDLDPPAGTRVVEAAG